MKPTLALTLLAHSSGMSETSGQHPEGPTVSIEYFRDTTIPLSDVPEKYRRKYYEETLSIGIVVLLFLSMALVFRRYPPAEDIHE